MNSRRSVAAAAFAIAAVVAASAQESQDPNSSFRFRTGVDLINVNATVVDGAGRFVAGLRKEDFRLFEDDQPQTISHFNSERVPVSLGIVLDTSGSMDGEKMAAARRALERFLYELLGPEDEVFLYRFAESPELVHGWTQDRRAITAAMARIRPRGATAMFDAVADAMPLMRNARHRKKALLLISDGNDTSSHIDVRSLQAMIRDTEVLVYAIGIDSQSETLYQPRSRWPWNFTLPITRDQRRPVPQPFPMPGRRQPPPGTPRGPIFPPRYPQPPQPRGGYTNPGDERVNVAALRDITDDSGGRTEIIRSAHDLDQSTAWIADELSKQYYLGYPAASEKDGRWHTIRVEVRNYRVRARRGYVATP